MQISVTVSGLSRLFGDDLAAVVDVARIADEAGIHQIVMTDHLAIGPRTDRYPFAPKFPYPPDEPWLEPLATLAAFAAATSRVRLGTGVLIAPVRPALEIAKAVATIDVLSRGRVDLGIGTGWQREEFTDPGLPFVGRTARMEDAVRACRALWETDPPVSFASDTVVVHRSLVRAPPGPEPAPHLVLRARRTTPPFGASRSSVTAGSRSRSRSTT